MISGAADPARAAQAMASVEERLVHLDSKLIQLFDPPFDRGPMRAGLHQGLRARAFARTAASTPTRPPGSYWRRRCRAAAIARWSCGT